MKPELDCNPVDIGTLSSDKSSTKVSNSIKKKKKSIKKQKWIYLEATTARCIVRREPPEACPTRSTIRIPEAPPFVHRLHATCIPPFFTHVTHF